MDEETGTDGNLPKSVNVCRDPHVLFQIYLQTVRRREEKIHPSWSTTVGTSTRFSDSPRNMADSVGEDARCCEKILGRIRQTPEFVEPWREGMEDKAERGQEKNL